MAPAAILGGGGGAAIPRAALALKGYGDKGDCPLYSARDPSKVSRAARVARVRASPTPFRRAHSATDSLISRPFFGAVKSAEWPNEFGIASLSYTWTMAVKWIIENLGVTPNVGYEITEHRGLPGLY